MAGEDDGGHKKIWAAGYFAGKKQAQEEADNKMSLKSLASKIQNMNGTEKKVYGVVPNQDAWTISQIHTELCRITKTNAEFRTTERCVRHLKEIGLVVMVGGDKFTKEIIVADKNLPAVTQDKVAMIGCAADIEKRMKKGKESSPVESLYEVAEKIRDVSATLARLMDSLDSAIMEMEDQNKKTDADKKRIEQLKGLLSELAPKA